MQQLLQWMRHLVYPAAAIFLLWAGYQVLADTYISDAAGKILVVYNADRPLNDTVLADPNLPDCLKLTPDMENPSELALLGVCQAFIDQKKQGPAIELLNLHDSMIGEKGLNSGKVYEQLSAKVAHGSLLGVVSLLTSPDSQPVVRFCRSMQLPLLLAIAANNDLLSPGEDTSGVVFRMMPTNHEQAVDISRWIQKRRFARVALFHEPNSFGEYLSRQVDSTLKTPEYSPLVYEFEVREQMEFADLMPQMWCDRIDLIVYLGFAPRAIDLINKLKWYRADPSTTSCDAGRKSSEKSFAGLNVLLASGAYQEDLDDRDKFRFPFSAYAMLATKPVSGGAMTRRDHRQIGDVTKVVSLTQYGYDSYKLMAHLASSATTKGSGALRTIFSTLPLDSKTGHTYDFDDRGELVPVDRNKYRVHWLASSRPESDQRSER